MMRLRVFNFSEPNLYHAPSTYLNGTRIGEDFRILHELLTQYKFTNFTFVGPDTGAVYSEHGVFSKWVVFSEENCIELSNNSLECLIVLSFKTHCGTRHCTVLFIYFETCTTFQYDIQWMETLLCVIYTLCLYSSHFLQQLCERSWRFVNCGNIPSVSTKTRVTLIQSAVWSIVKKYILFPPRNSQVPMSFQLLFWWQIGKCIKVRWC